MLESTIQVINNSSSGLASLVWILGEFGERLPNTPYILEDLLENYSESESNELINSILLSSCKMFFKSPGEMQDILGKVFDFVFTNFNDADLKDRASYIYNLLKSDIEEAQFIICGDGTVVDKFTSTEDELSSVVFNEFNSLSVVYNKPEEKFIKKFIEVEEAIKETQEANEVEDKQNEENNTYDDNIVTDNYAKVVYSKNNLDNKVIINDSDFKELMMEYKEEIFKEINEVAEIEIDGFIEYLEGENVFVKVHKEDEGSSRMLLYSKDSVNNTFIITELLFTYSKPTPKLSYRIKHNSLLILNNYEIYLQAVLEPLVSS